MDEKSVERLAYYTTSIGLLYILLGLLSGFYMIYMILTGVTIPSSVSSAHSHLICLSILILIVGLAMKNWARDVKEKRFNLTESRLKSAQASVFLLALGTILVFICEWIQMSQPALVGYVLFLIGFLMVAIGWISGGKTK